MEIQVLTNKDFTDLSDYQSVPSLLLKGGCLEERQDIYMERNRRTSLEKGWLLSWEMKDVKMDLTKLGKYGECIAQIKNQKTGKIEAWPFTMLYIKIS